MQCDQCAFICRPLSSLFNQHYATHYTCNPSSNPLLDCLRLPVPPEQLVSVNEKTPSPRRVHQCRKCAKRFYKLRNYRKHLRTQHKPPFSCQLCSCTYRTKMAYLAHCQRHRRPKAIFECELCSRQFRSKDGLNYHRLNTCLRYECQHCKCTLASSVQLQQHLREVHQDTVSPAHPQLRHNGDPVTRCVCFMCGKAVKELNLERHLRVHREERPFVCDLCGKSFKFKNSLREHIITEMGIKDYVCEVCGRKFVKRCYLTKHSRQHQHNSRPKPSYKCNLCDAQFKQRRQLSAHRQQHEQLSCELCAKTFESQAQLQEHQLTEIVCPLCNEMFTSNEWLKQHVTVSHQVAEYRKFKTTNSTSSVYPCGLCGRKFTSVEKFDEHVVAEVRCELCDEAFDTNAILRQHVESVHNLLKYRKMAHSKWCQAIKEASGAIERAQQPTEYTCSICDKKLFHKRTLMMHERMHSGLKPFKCDHCDKAYVSKHSLNAHLVAEMNLRKFVCEYCPKRYNFHAEVLAHMKQCHEKRQYSCHVCGKEFGLLKYLNDHLTVHSSVKPFTCDKCNLSFRLKKFLVRHTRKYHQQEAVENDEVTEIIVES